jgi:hypothetical protein
MMALPKGQVLATTRLTGLGKALDDQQIVFLGQRLNSIPLFDQFPPPDSLRLPQPVYRPRHYTDWKGLSMSLTQGGQEVKADQSEPNAKTEEKAETTPTDAAGAPDNRQKSEQSDTGKPTPGAARLMG